MVPMRAEPQSANFLKMNYSFTGEYIYSAETPGSATSEQALANPYHEYITFAQGFLRIPFLDTVFTDTHFGK